MCRSTWQLCLFDPVFSKSALTGSSASLFPFYFPFLAFGLWAILLFVSLQYCSVLMLPLMDISVSRCPELKSWMIRIWPKWKFWPCVLNGVGPFGIQLHLTIRDQHQGSSSSAVAPHLFCCLQWHILVESLCCALYRSNDKKASKLFIVF